MKSRLSIFAAIIMLASCAHVPTQHDGLGFDERRDRLEALAGWEMRGRLAVDTGERAFQGRFQWRQDADSLALSVRGPLGGGILEVTGSPGAMTVRARGESWALDDPETELSGLLGWWMPVGSLNAWLLGLPDRLFEARPEIAPDGVLAALEQRLWRLEYGAYQLAEGVLVPRSIDMSHGALHLRLTVDTWSPVSVTRDVLN